MVAVRTRITTVDGRTWLSDKAQGHRRATTSAATGRVAVVRHISTASSLRSGSRNMRA